MWCGKSEELGFELKDYDDPSGVLVCNGVCSKTCMDWIIVAVDDGWADTSSSSWC